MIDLFFRVITRARWLVFATARGIYTGRFDPEGEPVVAPGFAVDEVGHVVITAEPLVLDTWWSVNLRLHSLQFLEDDDTLYPGEQQPVPDARVRRFVRSKIVRFIRAQATPVNLQGVRAYQFGTGPNRIQLLDPRDIATPRREWGGGLEL